MRVTSSILFTATLLLGNVLCCGAHNVEGRITCDGYEVAGVPMGDVNTDGEITTADINLEVDFLLTGALRGCPLTLADCNADNEISIADVNSVIDLILKR